MQKYCMSCGGINFPDANFCGKCAAPFAGAVAKITPQVAPQVVRPQTGFQGGGAGSNGGNVPYERAPAPSLSKRDRDTARGRRGRPTTQNEEEDAEADDGDMSDSVDFVPTLDRLEVEMGAHEGAHSIVSKVDLGALFQSGQQNTQSNLDTTIPKRLPRRRAK